MKTIHVWTDGSCLGNPGPGGWSAIICLNDGTDNAMQIELQEGYENTNNTRMELMAPIAVLKALKCKAKIIFHSDSKYVVDSHNKGWMKAWAKNGWRNGRREPILNSDLWIELKALEDGRDIEYRWVKAHAGTKLNERADKLARQAAKSRNKIYDHGVVGLECHDY